MNENKKIYIVEDVSIIRLMLEQCMVENGFDVVGSSPSAENAWDEIKTMQVDLVLLDINLVGNKNGIWLGKKLNQELQIPFIYITANQDHHASEIILETNPVGFIVKPINSLQLITTVKIALNLHAKTNKKQLLIQDGLKAINLTIDDIYFIQSDGNYLHIYLETTHFLIRSTMDAFLEKLDQDSFVRIHQRYVINTNKKFELIDDEIFMINKTLSISLKYRKELKDKMNL
jgi:DNA-binding LytR/AlgR family response regulator